MCEFSLFQLFLFYWITLNNWVAYIYQKACFASFELKLQGLHFPSLIAWYLISRFNNNNLDEQAADKSQRDLFKNWND